jgi:hypothetical protein
MTATEEYTAFPPRFWASLGGRIDLKPLGAVPQTLEQVLDRMLIMEAFARFGIAHDENRVDVIMSCFTDDIVLEGSNGSAEPTNVMRGREAVQKRLEGNVGILYGQRRHCMSNIILESLTETEATAIAYGMVPRAADGFVIQASVLYDADLRKEADGFWRFSRFFIGCDDYAGEGPGKPKFLPRVDEG